MRVQLGSERLLAGGALRGRRVGVVCNPASVDHQFVHAADRVAAHEQAVLAAIFGPQHGFRSDVQENMIETGARTGRYSAGACLFAVQRNARADGVDARGVDVLVIDLQDVGTRIYTYIYTMANCLSAVPQARRQGDRLRPAESDRRTGG